MSDLVTMLQASLFCGGEPAVDTSFAGRIRHQLDDECWVDLIPGWLAGADLFFGQLATRLPWRQRTVPMYERLVLEPRLVWWWQTGSGTRLPSPLLADMLQVLSDAYDVELRSIGCNFYRDGNDSVAWHGDRQRAYSTSGTGGTGGTGPYVYESFVATVSVGSSRPFLIRPRGGGRSHAFLLGQGDLCVMGGACQQLWEHTVPKQAAAGPRISIVFRSGVERAELSRSRNPNGNHRRHTARGVRVREHPGEAKGVST